MCELEEDIRQFTYSYELWDVLGTSVTLKLYYAIHPGHQKCFYLIENTIIKNKIIVKITCFRKQM